MGVRLVIHNFEIDEMDYTGTHNHDDLLHRDWVDQHPIYAITGLQEVLNTIENDLVSITSLINSNDTSVRSDMQQYTDDKVTELDNKLSNDINNLNFLDSVIDTESINLDYDQITHNLGANVIIYDDPNKTNILTCTPDGLYVPKLVTKDTNTITWSEPSYGETLKEFADNGIHFSHNKINNNLYDSTEANSWYWDSVSKSLIQPNNTITYNGIVSRNFYDNYKHTVRLSSTGLNSNVNGIILGFDIDNNNNLHTLSAIIQRDSNFGSWKFSLYYNFYLPNQVLIKTYNIPDTSGAWDGKSITLYAVKNRNLIDVSISEWDYDNNITDIEQAKDIPFIETLDIDLNDYSWGFYFDNKTRYGYSNISQSDSYFDKEFFYSANQYSDENAFINVKIQDKPYNAIQVNDNGLFVQEFLVSPDEDNALIHRNNGYYVKDVAMSIEDKRLNGLEETNGYYYVHKSHSFVDVTQTNHGFIIGDFIYYDNRTNLYKKAIAKDDFDINIVGMVSYIYNANKFEYICSGFIETDLFTKANGYIQGMPLYISDTYYGKVTQEQPDISKAVGYPVANTGLIISIERGIQYSQEAQIGDIKTSANDYNVRSDGYIKIAEGIEYKLSTVSKLLTKVDQSFINNYINMNQENNTLTFKNLQDLYELYHFEEDSGLNLFIKAF